MSKGKTALLAIMALGIGVLIGLWWAGGFQPAAPTPQPVPPPAALPLPAATLGDVRFTEFRAGKLQTREAQGASHWLRSFEVVIENLKNPEASMDSLTVEQLELWVDGKPTVEPIRSKMNDKFTLPPGLPKDIATNALVLSGFQAFTDAPTAGDQPPPPDTRHYTLKFQYGPSKIPVELGPVVFP